MGTGIYNLETYKESMMAKLSQVEEEGMEVAGEEVEGSSMSKASALPAKSKDNHVAVEIIDKAIEAIKSGKSTVYTDRAVAKLDTAKMFLRVG